MKRWLRILSKKRQNISPAHLPYLNSDNFLKNLDHCFQRAESKEKCSMLMIPSQSFRNSGFRVRIFSFSKITIFHFDDSEKTVGILEEINLRNIFRGRSQRRKLFRRNCEDVRQSVNISRKIELFTRLSKISTNNFGIYIYLDKLKRKKNIAF